MKKYKTKQRETIYNCLIENKDNFFTVDDLTAKFLKEGKKIGATTVYRNLNLLVEEGLVMKCLNNNKVYLYKFQKKDEKLSNFKCLVCNKVYNFSCDELVKLNEHMEEHHNFKIAFKNSLINGICVECEEIHE